MSKDKQSFKSACRLLTKTLSQDGISLPHARILDIVAKSWGHNDYQTYLHQQDKDELRSTEPFRRSRIYLTYRSSPDEAKKNGDDLFSAFMEAFNDYYKKAATPYYSNKDASFRNKYVNFPTPAQTYSAGTTRSEFLLVLEWVSGPDGFGPNTGIEFNVAFAIPYLNRRYKRLFDSILSLEVVESRVTRADITPYLKNKELIMA